MALLIIPRGRLQVAMPFVLDIMYYFGGMELQSLQVEEFNIHVIGQKLFVTSSFEVFYVLV